MLLTTSGTVAEILMFPSGLLLASTLGTKLKLISNVSTNTARYSPSVLGEAIKYKSWVSVLYK